ncbi:MAG: uridine phosphorylase [Paracoccaceae bacterium]
MKQLSNSELIVNNNGSVYHLGLLPEHICDTVITVGDPDRVESVSKHFDTIRFSHHNREFKTVVGNIGSKEFTVISTGIGTDNIDIVFNEIAFLLNYDLDTRLQNEKLRSVDIIRLGTSGSVSGANPLDSIVYSKNAIGMEDLFKFYENDFAELHFAGSQYPVIPCSTKLEALFNEFTPSLTLTAKGFYGPQFRNAQLKPKYSLEQICELKYKGEALGNIEMETAGIYGLSALLGFEAISINAILANRLDGSFSANAETTIHRMITRSLEILCK